jgi:hypothetical protein
MAVASAESFESGLPVLRYPDTDLERFAEAMTSMGGVAARHIVSVRDGSLRDLHKGFEKARALVADIPPSADKKKFIFYFTGHSDSRGLHFSDGLLTRDEFHKMIASVGADTKVAILDSCYSGALAAKGVKAAGEFSLPKAQFDEPSGAVFLAATSASDQAFEIDEIKGSLFTHHLTAGLYGLADFNQDGLITIEELYQYIYKQVNLNSLALPDALRQKPEYASSLSGRGALVVSFVRQNTAPVDIDRQLAGEITFSAKRGVQIFRIFKQRGEAKQIRLVPGEYEFVIRDGDQLGRTEFALVVGAPAEIRKDAVVFREVPNMKSVAKGARQDAYYGVRLATHVGSMWELAPHVEGAWASGGMRLPLGTWRLAAAFGGHRSHVEYDRPGHRVQTGSSMTGSVIGGAAGDFDVYHLSNGLSINTMIGIGSDFVSYDWDEAQPGDRSFDPIMPKVAAALGASRLLPSARTIELSFRREWLFATEKTTGDVLSFSASLFLVGYHF